MPWTNNDYPDSFKYFTTPVRDKAIDIANALVRDEHMEESKAIAIAASRAKDWAVNHNYQIKKKNSDSKDTDVKVPGNNYYVVPHQDGWAVKMEGKKHHKVYDTKEKAIEQAQAKAREYHSSLTIQRKDGTIQDRYSYNPHSPGRE